MEGDDKETQVKWIKFGHADSIAFLGKDTVMMGFGLHILFVDTSRTDKKEVLYQASSDVRGDGVQCVCAHRVLPCFALAEKCRHPRIIINSYPSFETIKVIEAFCETSYVAIRFSEMEYLVALTSLPDYSIVIWNWRTLDKMYSQATGIESPNQILRVSFSSPLLIAQANPNDQTLTLWEMNVCYKKTLLDKFKVTLPPSSRSPYSYCWGADGDLYCLDSIGNLYTIDLQTKECQLQISSSKQQQGRATPSLTWYKGGLVLNVPREVQFWRRKSPEGWIRMWSLTPQVPFEALVSATSKDNLVGWTEAHDLVQLISKGEHNIDCVSIRRYGANFDFACFINPIGEYFVSFGKKTGLLTVWNKSTGEMVSTLSWTKSSEVTAVGSNPKWPYLIAVRADGKINTFNLFDPTYPMELNEAFLSRNRLDAVRFWRSGAQFCVASRDIGEFFLVKLQNDSKLDVSATIKINFKIADYVVAETSTAVKLLVLPVSQLCCRSGHTLLVYQVEENLKTFKALQDITLPMLTIALQPAANQDELLCIPHRSRSVYILRCEGNVEITKKFVSGHQMKLFGMRCDGKHLLTFGVEGIVIVRAALETTCISLFNTHHRGAKGVKDIAFDPYCQHVVSLGEDGTLVCTRLM